MLKDNARYKDLILEPGTFVPEVFDDYPVDDPYVRLYQPVYDREFTVDENYPFVDDSLADRWLHFWAYPAILYGVQRLRLLFAWGMKVEGRSWLRKYRKQLKGGAITVCNHCHRADAEAVLLAVRANRHTKIPMFAPNFATKDQKLLKAVGGVPIPPPEAGMAAMKKFNQAFDEFHRRGYWFHIFPESCKWNFYKPLRPFQKGAFTMSYKYGMPIVPCMIVWRERKGLFKWFGPKNTPLLTLRIGEPVIPDTSAVRKVEVERILRLTHERMCRLGGIVKNTWPAME